MADTPAGLLQRERELARTLLGEAYAQDWIDQGELDHRLDLVERATTVDELRALTRDVRPVESTALVPAGPAAPAPAGAPQARIGALFGSVERGGVWQIPASAHVRVVFGSVTLDMRQAVAPPGPIALSVNVWFGSLDIIVPPGWQIDNQCAGVLAAVEQDDSTRPDAPGGRVLRLTGKVVFGSVSVTERLPGEGLVAAHLRRRKERKALAERARAALPRGRGE